ncbi:MAG: hypothetical protein M1832_006049 [Thelocarpon impressellum]|nr:MAG: hypothetical protein M1832_006049 [Thelocarpon impressellum]
MAGSLIDDTPTRRGRASAQFNIHETKPLDEHKFDRNPAAIGVSKVEIDLIQNIKGLKLSFGQLPTPLTTSKRGNQAVAGHAPFAPPKQPSGHPGDTENEASDYQPMDQLLAKLAGQQYLLRKQQQALSDKSPSKDQDSSSDGSVPFTPATEEFDNTLPSTDEVKSATDQQQPDPTELQLLRLKEELQVANNKIARMDQELSQTRITKHTLDEALGPASEVDFPGKGEVTEQTICTLQTALNASTRPFLAQRETRSLLEDSHSDHSEPMSAPTYTNRSHAIWGNPGRPSFNMGAPHPVDQQCRGPARHWDPEPARPWFNRSVGQAPGPAYQQHHRAFPGPQMHAFGDGGRAIGDFGGYSGAPSARHSNAQSSSLGAPYAPRNNVWGPFHHGSGDFGMAPPTSSYMPPQMYQSTMPYQPRPIGTPLSPTAAEFTAGHAGNTPWNATTPSSPGQTYVSPTEPLNYRRLLDRTVNCNWKYIVDKIVCNNDQQASIFLQQKLKIGTAEQKFEIVEAIVAQAYPLMVNRFGNFLVQRCFEHGTPEQVVAIANAIRGNTLNLSMDAFGCHVVQKAFDSVPEEYKAIMVHELLRRIPETVIHRYACHVWQKLFELRWNDSPPQIMKYVNESLRGMWHEVALGETGSLVVQNIFENCLEEDKRPCINEVLSSIDIVAHGQFGNWCIQHICEHGAPLDRSRAIDHVVRYATEYSMDQFASKVVEKCLKIVHRPGLSHDG